MRRRLEKCDLDSLLLVQRGVIPLNPKVFPKLTRLKACAFLDIFDKVLTKNVKKVSGKCLVQQKILKTDIIVLKNFANKGWKHSPLHFGGGGIEKYKLKITTGAGLPPPLSLHPLLRELKLPLKSGVYSSNSCSPPK